MSKLPITYDRLGKKRAQQAHLRAHVADSDDEPLDSHPSPTHQQSESKSEDRPRRDRKPLKIPRRERSSFPDHKKSHLSRPLTRSNSVQQPSGFGPLDVAPNPVQDAHPSKRKRVDLSSNKGKAGPATQALKRRKVSTPSHSDTEHSSPSPPPPPSKLRSSSTTRNSTAYNTTRVLPSVPPSQKGSASNKPAADQGTSPPASPTTAPGSRPATPKKHPRDISQIFASHGSDLSNKKTSRSPRSPSRGSPSTSSTPRRARMLSRSVTFPSHEAMASTAQNISADASPSLSPAARPRTSVIQKNASWPIFSPSPSKSDSHRANLQHSGEIQDDSVTEAPVARPAWRTYSSSRSFLVPLSSVPPRDESSLDTNDWESQDPIQHVSYADLRKKYRVDLSSDDDLDTGISAPVDLKTIGELRNKGENRRFMDDMGYLLEGLAPKMTIAVKRLSAIKLVNNMGDLDYAKRAKACDALGMAWDALEAAKDGDKVLDVAIVSFAALTTRDPRLADEFARQPSAAKHLSRLLDAVPSSDPFGFSGASDRLDDGRRLGLGKPERTMIAQLRGILSKAEVLEDNDYCTSRKLCSQSLLAMRIHTKEIFSPLLESLLRETDALSERLQSYNIGLPIMPDPSYDTPDIQHISNIVQTIESSLLPTPDTAFIRGVSSNQREHISTNLMKAFVICAALDHQNSEPKASTCLTNILRLLVKLSDASSDWAIELARTPHCVSHIVRIATLYHTNQAPNDPDTLAADKDLDANRLDIKCLALALLTSMLLEERTARSSVFESRISLACVFGRSCMSICQCRGRIRVADVLITLYLDESQKSHEMSNPEAAFLEGHLAILLGLACEGAERARVVSLLKGLPGSNNRAKFTAWIDTIREFVDLYSDLARGFAQAMKLSRQNDDSGGSEDETGTPRGAGLDTPLFGLEEAKGGEKGVEIAERVIRVLEAFAE